MKFENIQNVGKLFQIIRDECTGTVELVSTEGDRINLKSRLSQYISMVRLLDAEFVRELQLVASDPADVERLLRFMRDGE
ncbi:MAG: polya polymerase [Hungatella hathewayi]|uniref:polya polymerase n=1 Tax=Hungatella hathewayi TaxID=154046 RepID=UPI0039919E4E